MFCPLLVLGNYACHTHDNDDTLCGKAKCAWWNNTECCIKTISIELIRIEESIRDCALPRPTQINVRKK